MTEFKVGDKVIVDLDMPRGSWHKCEGIVTDPNYRGRGNSRVKLTALGPNAPEGVVVGSEYTLIGLTKLGDAGELESVRVPAEAVVHPAHYGGGDDPYEVIKVAEAWGFDQDAYLFNVLKYIARAGKKGTELQDHKKANFYLERKIKNLEEAAK